MIKRHPSPFAQMPESTTTLERDWPSYEFPGSRILDNAALSWWVQASISLLGLVLFLPLILVIALLIKLTSRGPVFYRGERVGQGERIFTIYKFRTLAEGAEAKIGARLLNEEDRDVYYTKVGKFLKRSKLDELPQLVNVLRGEMRLVGPRPLRPVFLEQFKRDIPLYPLRFLVPPGLTGIAQLRGGYYTSPRNKLRYDLIYIKNWSFLLDLRLVLLTWVKILDRWLSLGFFTLFLLLFLSFIPPSLQSTLDLPFFGKAIDVVYLSILLVAGWVFFKRDHLQFALYRGPLNLPIFLFVLFSLFSAFFAETPSLVFQRAGYYVVTGFLVSFLIVNSFATEGFVILASRVIALTSVAVSLIGLFQIFLDKHVASVAASALLPQEGPLNASTRISSTLENPVVLAVYLVLGIPLLLSEVIRARDQRERDFWLVCATVSFVGVFCTQTRVGLLALLVTTIIFFSRRLTHIFSVFAIFLLLFLFITSLGTPRFSVSQLRDEAGHWLQEKTRILQSVPARTWLVGGTVAPHPLVIESDQPSDPELAEQEKALIPNMHVTLMLEHGVVGWCIFIWLVGSALLAMKRAYNKAKDPWLKTTLLAIISSILGFLVSMNGMNTFHNLTLQVFFWSVVGIGLGIVIRLNDHRRHNLIWRFGDAGD